MVALFWQTEKVGEWQVIWCLKRPQMIHDIGSLCISTMLLFNFFLIKRTIKQVLQVKNTQGKTDRGEFNQHALLHHQALLHYILSQLPLFLLLIINILLLLLLILLLLLLFKEVYKASRPSLLSCMQWPVGQALASSSPGSKILTGFKLFKSYKNVMGIRRLWFSDLCKPKRTWRTNIKLKRN